MFNPISALSIQGCEYEGGGIPRLKNRTSTDRDQNNWFAKVNQKKSIVGRSRLDRHRRKKHNTDRLQTPGRGTILVPIDFTAAADNAFDYAISVAQSLNSSITVVHVIFRSYAEVFINADQKKNARINAQHEAHRKLTSFARNARKADVRVSARVRDGLPE